jgi:hypothetical protein
MRRIHCGLCTFDRKHGELANVSVMTDLFTQFTPILETHDRELWASISNTEQGKLEKI